MIITAVVLFVFPDLYVIFPYIKRIKLWEAELELQEKVKELDKELDRTQDVLANEIKEDTKNIEGLDENNAEMVKSGKPQSVSYKNYLDFEVGEITGLAIRNTSDGLVFICEKFAINIKYIIYRQSGITIEGTLNDLLVNELVTSNAFTSSFISTIKKFAEVAYFIIERERYNYSTHNILRERSTKTVITQGIVILMMMVRRMKRLDIWDASDVTLSNDK